MEQEELIDCDKCGYTHREGYNCADVSASSSNDLLSAGELTRIQETKLRYLIEKGGKHSAITVHVGMPDGSIADVDPFGRVTWRGR